MFLCLQRKSEQKRLSDGFPFNIDDNILTKETGVSKSIEKPNNFFEVHTGIHFVLVWT